MHLRVGEAWGLTSRNATFLVKGGDGDQGEFNLGKAILDHTDEGYLPELVLCLVATVGAI